MNYYVFLVILLILGLGGEFLFLRRPFPKDRKDSTILLAGGGKIASPIEPISSVNWRRSIGLGLFLGGFGLLIAGLVIILRLNIVLQC